MKNLSKKNLIYKDEEFVFYIILYFLKFESVPKIKKNERRKNVYNLLAHQDQRKSYKYTHKVSK